MNNVHLLSVSSLGVAGLMLCGFLGVWVVGRRTHTLTPALVSLVLHVALTIALYLKVGLIAPDATYYDRVAQGLANGSNTIAITPGKEGWPYLLSAFYYLFGHDPMLGLITNAIAAALTVSVLGEVAHRLALPRRATAWIAALLPTALFWSSLLLRESLTWLCLSLVMLGLCGLTRGRKPVPQVAILVVALGGLLTIRGTAAILVTVPGMVAIILTGGRESRKGIITVVLASVALAGPLMSRVDTITSVYTPSNLNASRAALGRASVTTAFDASSADAGSLLGALPKGLPRVIAGPFPWEWGALGIPFAVDGILWCALLLLAIRGWFLQADRRRLLVAVLPAAALVIVLGMTSGNYGTMQRLRLQPAILIIPLAAAGLISRRDNRLERKTAPQAVPAAKE